MQVFDEVKADYDAALAAARERGETPDLLAVHERSARKCLELAKVREDEPSIEERARMCRLGPAASNLGSRRAPLSHTQDGEQSSTPSSSCLSSLGVLHPSELPLKRTPRRQAMPPWSRPRPVPAASLARRLGGRGQRVLTPSGGGGGGGGEGGADQWRHLQQGGAVCSLAAGGRRREGAGPGGPRVGLARHGAPGDRLSACLSSHPWIHGSSTNISKKRKVKR